MKIEITDKHDKALFEALVDGVRQHRNAAHGPEEPRPLNVVAKDDNGQLIGGVSCRTVYQNLLVEVLWVDKAYRGTGLGRRLMEQAEQQAKSRGCLQAQVDTLSFQAPDFYQKLGFEVVGIVPSVAGNPERYFLVKPF